MKKFFTGILISLGLFLSTSGFASDVSDFKSTWTYKALMLQGDIDLYSPLGKSSFITTHNSYNAGVYSQNGSYIDPNQKISVYDQLQIGVRALELDVHYTLSSSGFWPWEWKISEELKLSHAKGDLGTHPNDRFFTQGLNEIKNWLSQNPDEVIIIYLEDYMEGKYDKAISEMNGIIGSLVYKPNGCQSLPMNISKSNVLGAGKQILLTGGNCATVNWSNYVFKGSFSSTESLANFTSYPTCTAGSKNPAYLQSHLVRIFEDSTTLSDIFGNPGPPITATDAFNMTKCGIGAIGLDQIVPNDPRLAAQIWSWGTNEPNNVGGEDCAVQRHDGRFNDLPCTLQRVVACRDQSSNNWFLTQLSYMWTEAAEACSSEFPGDDKVFSVPVNGYENAKLHGVKTASGVYDAWINYTDMVTEGVWVAEE